MTVGHAPGPSPERSNITSGCVEDRSEDGWGTRSRHPSCAHIERSRELRPLRYHQAMLNRWLPSVSSAVASILPICGVGLGGCTLDFDALFEGDGGASATGGGGSVVLANCLEVCPPSGGTCNGTTCEFECEENGSCDGPIVCPAGVPCSVKCTGPYSCDGGVDCSAAMSCDIVCGNQGSCSGLVQCSGPSCTLQCSGPYSCGGSVKCTADSCKIECSNIGSCSNIECAPGVCDIECTGSYSCDTVDCNESCACAVECNDIGVCSDVACRQGICQSGDGCTSEGSCNACL